MACVLLAACSAPATHPSPKPPPRAASTSPAPQESPTPNADDWPTYHRDATRTGVDPGPAFRSVTQGWSQQLDGQAYAEPLVVGGAVIVATENDSVYSFERDSGRLLWRAHLGSPVPLSELPCGDVNPVGITSTPVADPARKLLYVVGLAQPVHHQLWALSLTDGSIQWQRTADASGSDARIQNQRAALALGNGYVYIPYGGRYRDCGDYHGMVVAISESGQGGQLVYRVPSSRAAGIWAPPGPSLAADGSLYVTTGNSFPTTGFDYGDSVLELSPDLRFVGWFATADWRYRDDHDLDLGSVGPTLLGNGLIFQTGKVGTGFLLRAGRLGGIGGQAFAAPVCQTAFGGTAYQAPIVYVPCLDQGLTAVKVSGDTFSVAWRSPPYYAEPPIVAGGIVWSVDRASASLLGLDPANGTIRYRFALGGTDHFATPAASAGWLLVAAGNRLLAFRGTG